jgi:hypothetical protein
MYIPRNWEFGSALAKLRNLGWGGGLNPQPPRYETERVFCLFFEFLRCPVFFFAPQKREVVFVIKWDAETVTNIGTRFHYETSIWSQEEQKIGTAKLNILSKMYIKSVECYFSVKYKFFLDSQTKLNYSNRS